MDRTKAPRNKEGFGRRASRTAFSVLATTSKVTAAVGACCLGLYASAALLSSALPEAPGSPATSSTSPSETRAASVSPPVVQVPATGTTAAPPPPRPYMPPPRPTIVDPEGVAPTIDIPRPPVPKSRPQVASAPAAKPAAPEKTRKPAATRPQSVEERRQTREEIRRERREARDRERRERLERSRSRRSRDAGVREPEGREIERSRSRGYGGTSVNRTVTMRSGKWGEPVATVERGTPVRVLGCEGWCLIDAQGVRGWVHESFLGRGR